MKVLTLSLKRKWFDMIAAGIKKEEYRERDSSSKTISPINNNYYAKENSYTNPDNTCRG